MSHFQYHSPSSLLGQRGCTTFQSRHALFKESSAFFQEARLDKQNLVERLSWTGSMLYDLCDARLKACRPTDAEPMGLLDLFAEDVIGQELVGIVQLIGPKGAGCIGYLSRALDHLASERLVHLAVVAPDDRQVGAVGSHMPSLLNTEGVGRHNIQRVAFDGTDKCQRNACAAGRVFHNSPTGTEAAIRAHVPWTRRVRESRTTHGGQEVDLPDFILGRRDRLVMKPNDEYGGKGVFIGWEMADDEWTRALGEALGSSYVVQERVDVLREEFPVLAGEEGSDHGQLGFGDFVVDLDPYVFGGEVEGFLTRLSATSLANVTSGAGQVPSFLVEPRP